MKALVVGETRRFNELQLKLPLGVKPSHYEYWEIVDAGSYDIVFDLNFDNWTRNIEYVARLNGIPVIVCAVKKRLSEAVFEFAEVPTCFLMGMSLLPGFINREITEVSLYRNERDKLERLMQQLNWKYRIVEDRAGMVAPRIVCMIINEACYTLQEGTASIQDIDLAMKLGTNYPYGPFEWADKIGIKDVYETLDAIYHDTRDERYKICPLLKTKYLKGETFY